MHMNMNTDKLLTPDETAKMLCLKVGTLSQMRWRKQKDLPWVKLGKVVRYKLSDIVGYIDKCSLIDKEENDRRGVSNSSYDSVRDCVSDYTGFDFVKDSDDSFTGSSGNGTDVTITKHTLIDYANELLQLAES